MKKNIISSKVLTIIVPIFNEERTIIHLIDKIEKQTYIKKQIILIDDFSSDGSVEKLKKYKFKK